MPNADVMTFVAALTARGVTLKLAGNRLRVTPYTALTSDDRAYVAAHREELKSLVRAGDVPAPVVAPPPPTPPPREPEPELYVTDRRGRHRVTEADVRKHLASAGALHEYDAGRLSKARAYRAAQLGMRQCVELFGAW